MPENIPLRLNFFIERFKLNILVVVPIVPAKQGNPTAGDTAGTADRKPQDDAASIIKIESVNSGIADFRPVNKNAVLVDGQNFQKPGLRPGIRPPGRCVPPFVSAEAARTAPETQRNVVNGKVNVAWVLFTARRNLGGYFKRKFQFLQLLPLFDVIWNSVFQVAVCEPENPRVYRSSV